VCSDSVLGIPDRCNVPPIPAWLQPDSADSPDEEDGSWDSTLPDLTRKIDP
jgi:hypothetical protein